MSEKIPLWKENKKRYNVKYAREHTKKITIQIYEKDYKCLEYWKHIPNKVEWFKQKLIEYAKENGLE